MVTIIVMEYELILPDIVPSWDQVHCCYGEWCHDHINRHAEKGELVSPLNLPLMESRTTSFCPKCNNN